MSLGSRPGFLHVSILSTQNAVVSILHCFLFFYANFLSIFLPPPATLNLLVPKPVNIPSFSLAKNLEFQVAGLDETTFKSVRVKLLIFNSLCFKHLNYTLHTSPNNKSNN